MPYLDIKPCIEVKLQVNIFSESGFVAVFSRIYSTENISTHLSTFLCKEDKEHVKLKFSLLKR